MPVTLKYPHGDITVPCYEIEGDILPQFLYQYVDITNEDQKNTLKSPYLYFGSPLKFNDPHDRTNQINYSFLRDENFFLDFSILECSKYFPENTPEDCFRYARDRWNFVLREGGWDKVSPQILNHIQQRNLEELKTYGALCTSLIKNNYLMWSYYANSHKGICLEFDNQIIRKHIGPVFAGTIVSFP